MSERKFIHNSYNVSDLVFHFVCPTKYCRVVIDDAVDEHLKQICVGIEERYDYISFLEIGADKDQVHFLIQSTPNYSPDKIITMVKSITERRMFAECPQVKAQLWGGSFWSDEYFVSSVGKHTSEKAVQEYVENQGKQNEYTQLLLRV